MRIKTIIKTAGVSEQEWLSNLMNTHLTLSAASEASGVKVPALRAACIRHGVEHNSTNPLVACATAAGQPPRDWLIDQFFKHGSAANVARANDINHSTVRAAARRYGLRKEYL